MFKNYLKIAFRNLSRNKLYTLLNLAGLTFGIFCFLMIGLYLFDELTFDQQHHRAENIYRVIEQRNADGEAVTIAGASYKLAVESKDHIAEVVNITKMSRIGRANLVDPDHPVHVQENVTVADENFLEIFDFPLLHGDKKTALTEPNTIIITEELAERIFRTTQVLGKALQFSFWGDPLTITGVLENHPRNSSFDFNSVLSAATFNHPKFYGADWTSTEFSVYVLLEPGGKPAEVAEKMTALKSANYTPPEGTSVSYSLQPLTDMHLYSANIEDGGRNSNVAAIPQGNPYYIQIFAIVSIFVLLIACINYMNLTTARATNRAKEVGIRKVNGAFRKHLVYQFLLESLVLSSVSFVLAVIMVNLFLPAFNQFINKQLSLDLETDYRIWLFTLFASFTVGLLSGSYPALLLSRFHPVSLLKNLKLRNTSQLALRKGLVVFQFTISVVMILTTLVLFLQVRFMNKKNLGFNHDLLVVVDVNTGKARQEYATIRSELGKIPTVKSVSVTSRVPGEWKEIRKVKIRDLGNTAEHWNAYLFGADENFTETFQVELLSGRDFRNAQDSTAVIINETAAQMLNITEAAGQLVEIPSASRGDGEFRPLFEDEKPFLANVVGIAKDFHFQSLHTKIAPLVLAYCLNPIHPVDYFTAKIEPQDIPATLEKMKTVMLSVDESDPFEYHFLNEQLSLFYLEDQRRQTLLIWAALSTIFIACLGLFGLATYAAEQRIKEIGIRKVLGASVVGLTTLLSKDFLKLVLIANGLAFPLAWWAANKWLQDFAYRIDIQWWMFVVAGVAAVGIALLTVSFQAIRAALANPVESLRSE